MSGITDKWGIRHTCYADTATRNLKDFHNSSQCTCSHIVDIKEAKIKFCVALNILQKRLSKWRVNSLPDIQKSILFTYHCL